MCFTLLLPRNLSTLRQIPTQNHVDLAFVLNGKLKNLVQQEQYLLALQTYAKEPHFSLDTSKFTFPSLLKACSSLPNLHYGRTIHAKIIGMGLQFDPYISTSLINMYRKCGSFATALQLFENMSTCESLALDVTMWNAMLDGYLKNGLIDEGLVQFRRMQMFGIKPDGYSLSILLGVLDGRLWSSKGKEIHGYVVRHMFDEDPFVVTALVHMYSNNNKPNDAWCVFEQLGDKKNVVVWNAMIKGFNENGMWRGSLKLYSLIKNEGCRLVSSTFSSTLSACTKGEDEDVGKQVHSDVVKRGFDSDTYTCTSLVTMYSRCGLVDDAEKVFGSAHNQGVELWNSMISAYIHNNCFQDALSMYHQMHSRAILSDSFTISNILASSGITDSYDFGRTLHGELIKRPMQNTVTVQSALLTMYARCCRMDDAFGIFGSMSEKDVVAWGSMISGYCQNGNFREALDLYKEMELGSVKPDSTLIANLITASTGLGNGNIGCCVHGYAIKSALDSDAFVCSSLIELYSRCGLPDMAVHVFTGLEQKNLVVWNCLMTCYCQNGLPDLSLTLLSQMKLQGFHPDSVSMTIALAAVSSVAALLRGKAIHGYHVRLQILDDIQVANSLVDMYVKCGCLKYAEHLFQKMPKRNLVTWNSMIAGYGSHGECSKAIHLFGKMRGSGSSPDHVTFLSLISSCNHSGMVNEGLRLFRLMEEYKIEPTMEHYINIVDLLGRAGCLRDAFNLIINMSGEAHRSVWLSLLSACRVHGDANLGEIAAKNLIELEPDRGSNYVQLLNLYIEAGLQEKAAELRASMRQKGLKKVPGRSWVEVQNQIDVFHSADSSSPKTIEIYQVLRSLRNNMRLKHEETTDPS